ncbi:MAG: prolyl oligopeptidase family serine peptidase [Pseudomonadota bacterium]
MRNGMKVIAVALSGGLMLGAAWAAEAPKRVERGNLVMEGVPEIPAELTERLNRYQQARSAAFSGWLPDGSALLSTRFGETAQIHRVTQPMGARNQLTFYPEPIGGALPHPKKNGFVFSKDAGGNEFFQFYYFDIATGEATLLTDGKSRNTSAVFSRNGGLLAFSTTRRNGKDVDIHLVALDGKPSTPLLEKEGEWNALDFSPDAKTLLVRRSVSINESELYLLDLASKALTRFHPTKEPAYFGEAQFSHDGKQVYFTSDENTEFRMLRVQGVAGGEEKKISAAVLWNIEEFEISDDGRKLAYVSNEDGLAALYLLDLASGRPMTAPKLPVGQIDRIAFDSKSQRLGFSIDRATNPGDVYAFRLGDKALTRWTASEVGGLNTASFVEPTLVRYPSFDGLSVPAFVYKPRGTSGKLPVIISIHGGPEAQALPTFSPILQFYMKELGIAVITPNVRGSDGYGKGYLKLDNGFLREDSVKDIGALLHWIAKQPDLDSDRVLVTGGSYGGYMTLAAMTHFNDRFMAGIDIVGISNFVTFLTNTQDYRRDLRRVEYGDERIPEMRAFQEKIAPLNNAAKITKPMFIIQGLNDPRVPASEAEQMVAKIRANGGEVWYLAAKDEGHGFRKKANRDFQAAATVLFLRHTLLK